MPISLVLASLAALAGLVVRQIADARRESRRNNALIAAKTAELETITAIQIASWNSIDEGIGVFDAAARLVSWNRRYQEIHDLPGELLVPGTHVAEIIGSAAQCTGIDPDMAEPTAAALAAVAAGGRLEPREYVTDSGRAIEIRFSPMPGGGFLSAARDITARRKAEQRLIYRARHDVLTDLWNRAAFVERLSEALTAMARGQSGLAVLYLDLDHFKDINDTLGHPAGDRMLKAVAERLLQQVRAVDTVARFGGDEFAILLSQVDDPQDVSLLAQRLMAALSLPFVIDGSQLHIGTSIGICLTTAADADAEDVMKKADLALYRVKEDGRGTHCFYEQEMNDAVRERVTVAAELRRALQNGELFLEYQPQVDLRDGSLIGLEALVRWRHPERGLLMPASFIPIAEKTGLIAALGGWVLREALAQGRRWLDEGRRVPTVAVNVSAIQVRGRELERELEEALQATGFPASLLELEITESAFFQVTHERRGLIERWHSQGIRIAIDDFGTGYSSLEYLRVLHVDRLKIATNFIRGVDQDRNNAAITAASIQLAAALGVTAIAEGVETPEEGAFLLGLGCVQAQGYLYGRPQPAHEVAHRLPPSKVVVLPARRRA